MDKLLGIFDFDYTILQDNSDTVARDLLPAEVIESRLKNLSSQEWTAYMGEVFHLLFEERITIDRIKEAIISIPQVPDFIQLFRDLKKFNCDIIIISDSNSFFIEEWLKSREIRALVNSIYSNPAIIREGKLFIEPFHEQDWCELSSKNLCKGHILQTHIKESEKEGVFYSKKFYVGDGYNDLCPSLKLDQCDIVFPRLGYPLIKQLQKAKPKLSASVVPWENTNNIWEVIRTL